MSWPFKTYTASLDALDEVRYALQNKNYDRAEAFLTTARLGLGDDQKVLMASAEIALAQGQWTETQQRWQLVIDRYPDVPLAYAHRALAVRMKGDLSLAAKLYHELILRFPSDVGAPIALVHLIECLNEDEKDKYYGVADLALLSLTKQYPDYAVVLVAYAKLARMQGNLTVAYDRLCKAKDLNRSDSNIWREIREIVEILENQRRDGVKSLFSPNDSRGSL